MSNVTVIRKTNVSVHPKHLNEKLTQHIENFLREKLENTWCRQYGYIKSIEMLPVVNHGLSNTRHGLIRFDVSYRAKTFKPKSGQILEAKVELATEHGLSLEYGPLKIFIASQMLHGYKWSRGSFVNTKLSHAVRTGDTLKVKIIEYTWTKDNKYEAVAVLNTKT